LPEELEEMTALQQQQAVPGESQSSLREDFFGTGMQELMT
jgi:hypothetical protein